MYFKGLEKIYGVAQSKKLLEYIKEFCEENKQYPNVFTKISSFYIFRILKKIMIGSNKWVDTQLFKCDSFQEGNRMSPLVKSSNLYETRFAQEMDDERNIHIRDVRIFSSKYSIQNIRMISSLRIIIRKICLTQKAY